MGSEAIALSATCAVAVPAAHYCGRHPTNLHISCDLHAHENELYGRGTPEAHAWVTPLLQQIRDDETTQVIAALAELKPRLLR